MSKPASKILLKLREALAELEMWEEGDGGPFDGDLDEMKVPEHDQGFLFKGATWRRAPKGDADPVFLHGTNAYLASTFYGSTHTSSPVKIKTPPGFPWACDGTVVLTFNSHIDAQFFAKHYHWEKRRPRQGDIVLMDELSNGAYEGLLTPWTEAHDDDVRLCLVHN